MLRSPEVEGFTELTQGRAKVDPQELALDRLERNFAAGRHGESQEKHKIWITQRLAGVLLGQVPRRRSMSCSMWFFVSVDVPVRLDVLAALTACASIIIVSTIINYNYYYKYNY